MAVKSLEIEDFLKIIADNPKNTAKIDFCMVFYYSDTEAYKTANERMQKMGILPVEPENTYWKDKSETYENPDGWRVILFNGIYKP